MRKALMSAPSMSADHLHLPAGGLDLRPGGPGEAVRAHLQGYVQLAIPQDLYAVPHFLDEAGLAQDFRGDARPLLETVERLELDLLELLAEGVLEPSFRHATNQGHLAALEGSTLGASAAGALALLTPP